MIGLPLDSTLIAELVSASASNVVTSLILLNPKVTLVTLPKIIAYHKIENRLIFNLVLVLLTRLARMGLVFAVQAVDF
jgi:hypothetical protein